MVDLEVPVDPAHQADQFLDVGRVQAGGRLVEQQQLRPGRQGPGDLQLALGAVGEILRIVVGEGGELEDLEQLEGFALDGCLALKVATAAGDAVEEAVAEAVVLGDADVVEHRHVGPQADVLEGARHAQGGDPVRFEAGGRSPADADGAGAWLVEAADQVEDGGLAGAVGADQPDHFTLIEAHVEIGYCAQPAELMGQPGDLENRGRICRG